MSRSGAPRGPNAEQAAVLDLRSSVLAAASAGTGKTYCLTMLYTALLTGRAVPELSLEEAAARAEVKPLRPGQVVAVTFTRKAAAELRSRVRATLAQGAAVPGAGAGAELRAHLRRCEEELAAAPISTIDAFCARLLREAGLRAGVPLSFEVARPEEEEELVRRVLLRLVAETLERPDAPEAAALAVLAREWGVGLNRRTSLPAVVQFLRGTLRKHGLAPAAVASADDFVAFDVAASGRELLAELRGALAEVKPPTGRARPAWDRFLEEAAFAECADLSSPEQLRRLILRLYPSDSTAAWTRAVKPLLRTALERAHTPFRAALARLLEKAEREVSAEKRRRGLLDFDDLLLLTRNLLARDGEFAAALRRRYRFILIDEFQDTNALQAEVFYLLAAGEKRPRKQPPRLVVVGDEKQSIYRFRGAEVSIMRRARAELRVAPLRASFRAAPALLSRLNDFFDFLARCGSADSLAGEESAAVARFVYEENDRLRPNPADLKSRRAETPVELLSASSPSDEGVPAPAAGRGGGARLRRFQQMEAIARRIRSLVSPAAEAAEADKAETAAGGAAQPLPRPKVWEAGQRRFRDGIRYGDIAVLARSLKALRWPLETAFTALGIPFRLLGGSGFFTRRETAAVVNLLTTAADPTDEAALFGFLRSPFAGLTDGTLFLLRRGRGAGEAGEETAPLAVRLAAAAERGAEILGAAGSAPAFAAAEGRRLQRAARLCRFLRKSTDRLSVAEILDAACVESGWPTAAAMMPDGATSVAVVRRLIELARNFERRGATTLADFTAWLRRRAEAERRGDRLDDDELTDLAAELPETADAVQVGTIHSAKGLEFPIVFLADLGARPAGHFSNLLFSPVRGAGLRVGGASEGLPSLAEARHEEIRHADAAAEEEERKRLLYVACTRARDHLVLCGEKYSRRENKSWRAWWDAFLKQNDEAVTVVPYDHPELKAVRPQEGRGPLRFENCRAVLPDGFAVDGVTEECVAAAASPETAAEEKTSPAESAAKVPELVARVRKATFGASAAEDEVRAAVSSRLTVSVSELAHFAASPSRWARERWERESGFAGAAPADETTSQVAASSLAGGEEADKSAETAFVVEAAVEETFPSGGGGGGAWSSAGDARAWGTAAHRLLEEFFRGKNDGGDGFDFAAVWRAVSAAEGLASRGKEARRLGERLRAVMETEWARRIRALPRDRRFVERPFARREKLPDGTTAVVVGALDLFVAFPADAVDAADVTDAPFLVVDYKLATLAGARRSGRLAAWLRQVETYAFCAAELCGVKPVEVAPALLFLREARPRPVPTAELWPTALEEPDAIPCGPRQISNVAACFRGLLGTYAAAVKRVEREGPEIFRRA